MAAVFIVWLTGAAMGALGLYVTLEPQTTRRSKLWCWAIFLALTLAGFIIANHEQRDQDAKDWAQADSENALRISNTTLANEVHDAASKIDKVGEATGVTIKGGLNDKLDYLINNLGPMSGLVANLTAKSEAEKEYYDVAMLDPTGRPMVPGPGLSYNSPLSDLLSGSYTVTDGKLYFKTDPETEQKLRRAIEMEPKFPFSYVYLGDILSLRHDPSSRDYYLRAKEILEETTLVPGHKPEHDELLERLKSYFPDAATPPSSVPNTSSSPP